MTLPKRSGTWSTQETVRLRELFLRGGAGHAARVLRRSRASVERRVARLFARPRRTGPWTAEEIDRLRESYGVLSRRELALVLGRSQRDVGDMVKRLRTGHRTGAWTADECRRLERLYSSRPDRALVVCLSRPLADIRRRAEAMCLAKDKRAPARSAGTSRRMPRWTAEEVRLLCRLYPGRDNLEVARALGRSVPSVANKAWQLGLRKDADVLSGLGRSNVARRRDRVPAGR